MNNFEHDDIPEEVDAWLRERDLVDLNEDTPPDRTSDEALIALAEAQSPKQWWEELLEEPGVATDALVNALADFVTATESTEGVVLDDLRELAVVSFGYRTFETRELPDLVRHSKVVAKYLFRLERSVLMHEFPEDGVSAAQMEDLVTALQR